MIKKDIENKLHSFSNNNLLENSLNLFSTLGYTTKRLYKVSSINDFKNKFLSKSFNEDKLLFNQWKNAKFLFELRPDDINSEDTNITDDKVQNKIIETYWFFAIELKNENYTKKQLSDITREINKQRQIPVFILFKYGNKLTFSIIDRRINKKDSSKDVLEKVVLIKDINFNKTHRAHIDILNDISFENIKNEFNVSNFAQLHNNWLKILSISALNDKFYKDLSNWFFWMLDNCKLSKDNDYQSNVMFGIRMVTRIIFNWFIKEKGLIDEKVFDKQNYINLLKPQYQQQGNLYYKTILQNLFFGCLSLPIEERRFRKKSFQGKNSDYNMNIYYRYEKYFQNSVQILELFKNIPFINGGLFECLDDKDNNTIIDSFTDNENKNFLEIPDNIFFLEEEKIVDISSHFYGNKNYKKAKVKGLFSILNSYKFTIDETTPIEEEIALDPELLGRVFENLLAAHNPETETTVRKSTGSYYTPREIVDYMCEQSLINYLKAKIEKYNIKNLDDKLEELLSYSEKHSFKDNEIDELIKAINEVKILDPACGSGAFPMGLLHKLVHLLRKLDPNNLKWKEFQIKNAKQVLLYNVETRDEIIKKIEQHFEDNEMDYSRKLYLIQNCIFGVDIQPMATQISRLRFFISLIVDEKINKNKKNIGILPLPNLETKFVAANTLIGLKSEEEHSLLASALEDLMNELKDCRCEYFVATDRNQKKKLRNLDKYLREQIINKAKDLNFDISKTAKLVQWNPYDKDKSSEWFDSKWMFGIEKFDIVIGNPPYFEYDTKNQEHRKQIPILKTCSYFKYASGGKLQAFKLFIALTSIITKDSGIVTMIFQNSFLADSSCENIRKYAFDNRILCIDSFPERDNEKTRVFQGVKMSVCILNMKKINLQKDYKFKVNFWQEKYMLHKKEVYFNKTDIELFDPKSYQIPNLNNIEKDLLKKIKMKKNISIACYEGEINMTNHKHFLNTDSSNPQVIKGAGIQRYYKTNYMSQGILEYLNEESYLKKYSGEKTQHHNCNRIACQGITGVDDKIRIRATIIPNNFYLANSCNYILDSSQYNLKYILGLFNSKLMNWIFKSTSTNSNVNCYEVEQLPFYINKAFENKIINSINKILNITKQTDYLENIKNQNKVKEYEKQIDVMVYKLYELTYEEVLIVDKDFSMSKEEYNNYKI